MRPLSCLAALVVFSLACGESKPPDAQFSIDPYPKAVNKTPLRLTGKKPVSAAVLVDGAEKVAAGAGADWALDLALSEGANRFAVGPSGGTAQQVEVALDTVPPTILRHTPDQGATGVPLNTTVEVVLSEAADCAKITAAVFSLEGVSTTLACSADAAGTSARLTPAAPLAAGTQYRALFLGAGTVPDTAGNTLESDLTWQFTTGTTSDTTPPPPPTFDAPPPPATPVVAAQATVGGTKEAGATVEVRRSVDGALRQDWTQAIAGTAAATWSWTFPLEVGTNLFELRSKDAALNVSTTVSFSVVRQPGGADAGAPGPDASGPGPDAGASGVDAGSGSLSAPTLAAVVTPTTVGNQVLTGTKPANSSVWNGASQLAPLDAATTWSALVILQSGANSFTLTAKNASGASSPPAAAQVIQYTPPGKVSAGQVRIDFEVRDMWDYIGDEFRRDAAGGANAFDHFGIDVWIEGPITKTGSGTYEKCVLDAAKGQRRHTRYVASVSHSRAGGCAAPTQPDCGNGFWWEPNYRSPNYLAALIESGRWNTNPPTANPFTPGVTRRDPLTLETWAPGCPGTGCNSTTVAHPELYFPFNAPCCGWGSKPRLLQLPLIDGMTEASTNAKFSNTTRLAASGAALGAWTEAKTYRWNLKDLAGAFVEKGPYLVQIAITLDRAVPAMTVHYPAVGAADRETCWDDAAAETTGPHRAEGIVEIDGTTATTVYWKEEGKSETVDACREPPSGVAQRVSCTCGTSTVFPCPAVPASKVGQAVKYLTPDKYAGPFPVKVQYCPTGACP